MSTRDAHIAIMVAAAKGTGLRLSAEEVGILAGDDAIEMAALNGLDEKDWPNHNSGSTPTWDQWSKMKPRRKDRVCRNFAVG